MPKFPPVPLQGSLCSRSRYSHSCLYPPTCSPADWAMPCQSRTRGGGLAVPFSEGHLTVFVFFYLFPFVNSFVCSKRGSVFQVGSLVRFPEANLAVLPSCPWEKHSVYLCVRPRGLDYSS